MIKYSGHYLIQLMKKSDRLFIHSQQHYIRIGLDNEGFQFYVQYS